MRKQLKILTGDIRFWILLFFLIRMIGITDPPLETGHSWRQVTVNMAARNFYEIDPDIFYPRVDMAGDLTGITGMEFPLLNWLIYLVSLLFGFGHWYGRLINLIVSSAGVYFFYLIIKQFFNRQTAFYASLLLLGSTWLTFSRKIMPDTFSVSLVLIALWFCLDYLYRKGAWKLILFVFLGCLGVLSKLPSIVIFAVLLIPFFDRQVRTNKKFLLVTGGILILLPAILWYFHWVPYLVERYGYWHFYMGTSFSEGIKEILAYKGEAAHKFYFEAFFSYSAFLLFLGGLVYAIIRKEKKLLLVFVIVLVAFLIIVARGGKTFATHNYYIVPFVPAMALVGGYALGAINRNWIRNLLALIIIAECFINQQHDIRIKPEKQALIHLESIADSVSNRNDLILINGAYSPVDIYFTHRKGWTMSNMEVFNEDILRDLGSRGCRFLFINKHHIEGSIPEIDREMVYDDEHFRIYKLEG